jgi:hypothetical protein
LEALEARVVPTVLDLSAAPGLSGRLHGAIFTGATTDNTAANGAVDPFVQLQHSGVEQGFNTTARPYHPPNDAGTDATFNHAIQRHAVPIVARGGITYYEFALGINQDSSAPLLSLDELRIYVDPSTTLSNYDPTTGELDGLMPVYDMDGGLDPQDATYVKLNSNFGANGITMFLDVPTSELGIGPSECIYIYSKFGVQNLNPGDTTGSANGGYEQWGHGDTAPLQPSGQVSVAINESSPVTSTGVNSVAENAVVYATSAVTPASGTTIPTGTVTYYFYDTSSPILGSTIPVLTWPQDVTLNGGIVPDSQNTAPLTPGSYSFIAVYGGDDTYVGTVSSIEPLTVLPAAVASFSVDAPSDAQHAGYPFNITVTARDAYNNPLTDYTGTAHFTSTDGAGILPTDYTFTPSDHGVHHFRVNLQTPGQQTVSVADTSHSAATGSASVLVDDLIPGLHFSLIPSVTSTTAGTPFSVTVTAYDANNQVATGYRGTIHFTTADHGQGVVIPTDYTFTSTDNGVHIFQPVTLVTAGPQTLSINDTSSLPNMVGASTTVTVTPSAALALSLTGFPSPVTAGTAGMFTVSAIDAYGNLATGYNGTVRFTSSDSQAGLPIVGLITNGTGSFTATLKTAGSQSLTATDVAQPSLTGTQKGIQVNPAAVSTLSVTGFPTPTTAGVPGNFVVTAHDAYGNVATSYTGTVHFVSSDIQAVLPGNTTLMSGVGTFTATFHHAGVQSLTTADTVLRSITGTQQGITVHPAAATRLSVSGFPTPQTAGVAGTFIVTALDAFGNMADSYTGTVRFSSSDAQASLPGNATIHGGTGTFSATLKTAGLQSLTATDTTTTGITGTEAGIRITPATAVHLRLSSATTATAGTGFPVTVTALDSFNNTAPGYRGTIHFTSSDASAALPPDYGFTSTDAGVYSFKATLRTVGTQSLTATDSSNGLGATPIDIVVSGAAVSRLAVAGYPSSGTAGIAGSFTVTAEDAYGNPVPSYAGTIFFSSSDAQAILPAAYTFSTADNGSHSFTATLKTAGTQSLTAMDSANKLTGTEGAISVNSAAVRQLATAFPGSTTAGVATSFTVTAEDAYGNPVTDFTSTVFFNSSDSQAVLPPAYTFSTADNGTHSFTATLKTPGTQDLAVIASDNSFSAMQSGITVTPALVSKVDLIAPNLAGMQSGLLSADTAYIAALYQTLLNRPADSTGVSHWLQLLLAGFNRQQLATAFWRSPEHRGVEVDQYYVTFLGRASDPAGRLGWVNAFLAGATEVDIMRGFLTSVEYQAAHPTDASFVMGLYSQVLGRAADSAGQAAWLLALQNGLSRQSLVQAVLTSAEADQRAVDRYYMLFLDRPADPAGEQALTNLLLSGRVSLESVGETFLASDEYFSRVATA